MSDEQLKAFLRHAHGDDELRQRVLQIDNPMRFRSLAEEAGFAISTEALANAEEISLAHLEEVRGGGLYIKCDGILGESTDSNHSRWIIGDNADMPIF